MKSKKVSCFKCGDLIYRENIWPGRIKPPYLCMKCGDAGIAKPRPKAGPQRLKKVGDYFAKLG